MVTGLVDGRGGLQAHFCPTSEPGPNRLLLAVPNLMGKSENKVPASPRRSGLIFWLARKICGLVIGGEGPARLTYRKRPTAPFREGLYAVDDDVPGLPWRSPNSSGALIS